MKIEIETRIISEIFFDGHGLLPDKSCRLRFKKPYVVTLRPPEDVDDFWYYGDAKFDIYASGRSADSLFEYVLMEFEASWRTYVLHLDKFGDVLDMGDRSEENYKYEKALLEAIEVV